MPLTRKSALFLLFGWIGDRVLADQTPFLGWPQRLYLLLRDNQAGGIGIVAHGSVLDIYLPAPESNTFMTVHFGGEEIRFPLSEVWEALKRK